MLPSGLTVTGGQPGQQVIDLLAGLTLHQPDADGHRPLRQQAGIGDLHPQSLGNLEAAFRTLAGTIQREAFVMSYNDIFFGMTIITTLSVPLVLFLRPLPKGMSLSMH